MKKVSLAVLVSFSALAGAAYAQTDSGVTMSTDPARAAAVEQRAQELQSRQQAAESTSEMPSQHHHKATHHKKAAKKAAPATK
ncbi:hypothetical protein QS306_06390 [Paraburkholderia bonniea]|uniref:hypothetical protein n=1 Tax=Paraburkholderia bonniea TaxID=2152891 RepID=UPI001291334B|nr:hypothetical protein [Paraburkholderia bonniea]WJF91256.1 hypothetical protein QS306_06390 [Paraburkholderia bonniea]WJF94571.1 hypothetical protein QS308_06400 [Paraburkholderia bonniea]